MTEGLQADAIKAIEGLVQEREAGKCHTVDIHEDTYSRGKLERNEKPDYVPGHLQLVTLQSLIDYIRDEPDAGAKGNRTKAFVYIASPTEVLYQLGAGGPYNRRA